MKDMLSFKILNEEGQPMISVACVSGQGGSLLLHDKFDDFKDEHEYSAHNIKFLLEGLCELFEDEDITNNLEMIRLTMSLLEAEPFNLNITYREDTVSEKCKGMFQEYRITHDEVMKNINNRMEGDSPMPLANFPMDLNNNTDQFFGSFKAPKKEEPQVDNSIKRTTLTFEDVVGMHEVKEKLRDVINQFKNAEKYKAWNIKPIKGIILYGPSGTGKSYIAEAFANEIDAKFFPLSSADIISKYLGESGKTIRNKFEEARKHPISIIYIDEVDSLAAKRDGSESNKERNATLNELLVQMASPENDNIVMVFATNMLELLDPAFLRSGRCDFKIEVSLPDFECRKGILELNSKGRPLADDVDFAKLARNMSGMNCADMAHVANEAARMAIKVDKDQIDMADFERAFEEMVCGSKSKTKKITDKEKDTVAIHETGHLFANELFKVNKTKKISILPRGTTLGFVMHVNEEEDDKYLNSKVELINRIRVCLAGRAAEEVFFGKDNVTTGAANDLEKANKLATAMVCDYAFVEEMGLSIFDTKNINNLISMTKIQKYVDRILEDAYNDAILMVKQYKDDMRRFADILKEREEMDGAEIAEVLEGVIEN